jgi:DHA1 family bicyclomycin/chloramphenicol resistance-like MFS transporter
MYLPAFPAIAQELHAGPGPVAYTLAAFFVGMALSQLVYGQLVVNAGRKVVLPRAW